MTAKNLVLNKAHVAEAIIKMAMLSIVSLLSYFSEDKKSIKKGENHYKSDHVESFTYNRGILRGDIHASMKNKVYKVTVSGGFT